jgi:hypothetical protein
MGLFARSQIEFESSYTLVEHAPEDSIQLEILAEAMKQVAKLSEAVGEGRYEDLLEILGHHPDRCLPDGVESENEEFRTSRLVPCAMSRT